MTHGSPDPTPATPSDPYAALPPEAWAPAHRAAQQLILRPLERFMHVQAASGLVLMIMAVVAMIWANSPFQHSYHALWHTPITVGFGSAVFEQSLHFWINDGLMVIFFFVVGLEIRREMHGGELSELKRAALPVAAAVGGMIVPALIYLGFNPTPATSHGWGVPMATDIAFAVGVLTLLGSRVPAALRVLLLALAIIDDIGAILVIAIFYSSGVSFAGLGIAALGSAAVLLMQRLGVRSPLIYVAPGVVVWGGMLGAGIHPTIAGVILGLLTPARSWFGGRGFLAEAERVLQDLRQRIGDRSVDAQGMILPLQRLATARREAIPPVVRLEAALHGWVAFGIMPIFALANAGVTLGDVDLEQAGAFNIGAGVALGLALGKPVGIVLASWLSAKLGICALPRGVDLRGLIVVGCVGGIGFTMALFIAQLAFMDPGQLGIAKLAVLCGSLLAGVVGVVVGRALLKEQAVPAVSVDEAERSTEY
ncbi:MAG TPA: Na+/H+ antiporter NhaA [Polyangiaceae bacterium]|nr:Na+/H+ antiporter NhaA [Polyangiaceae bacterium]